MATPIRVNAEQLHSINPQQAWPEERRGIALVHKKSLNTKQLEKGNTPTIECVVWKTIAYNTPIHLIGLYHPPLTNGTTTTMFLDEIMELLMTLIPKYNNILLLGNFNMHTENISNADNIIFNDTMEVLGLIQHVNHLHIGRATP